MQSGIPDFDTANPDPHGKDTDSFRATAYKNAAHSYLEPELMTEPWVATGNLTSTPGTGFHYSSTNFGLLGFILAMHRGEGYAFNQSAFIPSSMADVAATISWAIRGSPAQHDVVPGFDRTDYNGQDPKALPGVPVVDVSGVFAGYSASDFVGTPRAVAELGYALWGNSSTLMPAHYRDLMVPTHSFYGLA